MSLKKTGFAFAILSILPLKIYSTCLGVPQTWTGVTDQTWNTATNWSGTCIPGTGAVTDTETVTFATPGAGGGAISLNVASGVGLGSLTFNNGSTSYTISSSPSARFIQFNGASSTISILAGSHVITSPIRVNNTTLHITAATGSTLTYQGNATEAVGSTASLVFDGAGQFTNVPAAVDGGIVIAGSWTQSSGTVSNQNTLNVSGGSPANGNFTRASQGVVIQGGTYTQTNSGTVNATVGASSGMQFLGSTSTPFTLSAGTLSNVNNGAVTSNTGNIGSLIRSDGGFLMNGGTVSIVNNSPISGVDAYGTSLFSLGSLTINGGTISITNASGGACTLGAIGTLLNVATSTMNGGTVTISNNASTSDSASTVWFVTNFNLNNGTFQVDNHGSISGDGSRGNLVQSNSSATIAGGTFLLNNDGTVNQTAVFGSRFSTSASLAISGGAITLSNSGSISGTTSGGSILAASVSITMTGGTLTNSANTGTLSGTNTAGSIIQASTSIAINGGTLINDDTVRTPTLTVGTNGNLAGKGSFNNTAITGLIAITNSGTVTPGNPGVGATSPGTMAIHGGYTQSGSGKLIVNVLNNNTFSQLNIDGTPGTAQLAGTLEVGLSPGATIVPGDLYTIVQTTQGVTGTFSNLINNTSGVVPHLTYSANTVQLSFTPGLATFLSGFTEPLLSSVNEINTRLGRQMVRLRNRFPAVKSSAETACGTQFSTPLVAARNHFKVNPPKKRVDSALPWDVYFGPTGNVGEIKSKGTQIGFDYWSAGALAGFDYAFSQVGVGFLLNYDHIAGHKNNAGRFTLEEAHGSVYGTYTPIQELALNAIVGGSYEWYQISRTVGFGSNDAIGSPQGGEFDALFGVEYTFSHRQFSRIPTELEVVPLASLQYIYLNVGEYTEKGAGSFNLHMGHQNVQSLRSTLGTRLNYTKLQGGPNPAPYPNLKVMIDLAWQREYLDHNRSLGFAPIAFAIPSSTLIVPGAGRNFVLAGIDFVAGIFERYAIEASYDFQWNKAFVDHSFYLGFDIRF